MLIAKVADKTGVKLAYLFCPFVAKSVTAAVALAVIHKLTDIFSVLALVVALNMTIKLVK